MSTQVGYVLISVASIQPVLLWTCFASVSVNFYRIFLRYVFSYTDENNCCIWNTSTHFRVKVKRDYVMFSLVLEIDPQTCTPLERARRNLSIDMHTNMHSIGRACKSFPLMVGLSWNLMDPRHGSVLPSPQNGFRSSQSRNEVFARKGEKKKAGKFEYNKPCCLHHL